MEIAVVQIAFESPALGPLRASNQLKKKGVFISRAGVDCVWLRNDLETFKKPLKDLEARIFRDVLVLTEFQLTAWERAKEAKKVYGEIETHHSGDLAAQDTYDVRTIKNVGRIYQRTFIDTYCKVSLR